MASKSNRKLMYKAEGYLREKSEEDKLQEVMRETRDKQIAFIEEKREALLIKLKHPQSKKQRWRRDLHPPPPMLSVWMDMIPTDLFDPNVWTALVCPTGSRRLVLIDDHKTARAYNIWGGFVRCHNATDIKGMTILDCLFSYAKRTYYILDIICFNGVVMADTEFGLRLSWTNEEFPDKESDSIKFIRCPCETIISKQLLLDIPNKNYEFEVDGLIFIRNDSTYTYGYNQELYWVEIDMLRELVDTGKLSLRRKETDEDTGNVDPGLASTTTENSDKLSLLSLDDKAKSHNAMMQRTSHISENSIAAMFTSLSI